jgi:predicted SprT family Zn-dependent metalloprotease
MIDIKPSAYQICDFCGGMYDRLKDISTLEGNTVTMCKYCRKELVMALIDIMLEQWQ